MNKIPAFTKTLQSHSLQPRRTAVECLQINLGKYCNQACHHCHVDAGPTRSERMSRATVDRILALLECSPNIHTVDLTGGAPELNANFRYLVKTLHQRDYTVLDRCNLTVLLVPGQEDTADFLQKHQVQIVASLPCYSQKNVDEQRGKGVFEKSIQALKILNGLGYGKAGSGLILNLVYNPLGPILPPPQEKLEQDYQRQLQEQFGISFNQLLVITNMPIKRFLSELQRRHAEEDYFNLLAMHFNPAAVSNIMCRHLVSVGWEGQLYDCDFNQMLEIPLANSPTSLWDIESFEELQGQSIAFGNHCYGCTAGAGSSCGGKLI